MANPWLKKNPFMSLWLSSANRLASAARGHAAAAAKRQTTSAAQQAANEIVKFWTASALGTSAPAPVAKREKARK